MRNSILTLVVSLVFIVSACSQTTPTPPETPSKGISYSISFDTDEEEDNSYVSIKRNDDIYKFNAKFHESKKGSIKKLLVDKLGSRTLKVDGDTYRWIKKENGDKLYDCKLTDNTLKIYVDKEYANSKLINIMNEFGVTLKYTITGTDSKKEEKERAEAAIKRAQKDLERAKRDLERAKRKLKTS